MRIVQIIVSKGYGGAEKHTLQLARALIDSGHDVMTVGPGDSWMNQECKAAGLPFQCISFHGNYDLLAVLRLRRLIRQWNADIVHGQLTRGAHYSTMACAGMRAVPISTCHATSSHKHMHGSRRIIAVSNAVSENLLKHGYPAEKIRVIHNGVPLAAKADREPVRNELCIPEHVFAAVCVGRLIPDKGQNDLIDTIASLRENIHLYFIGDTDTTYGHEMLKLSSGHPRIHFMGYRSDVTRILGAFDLCVVPSRREACPIALIEASQAGMPIVANRVGGIPEVVEENGSGLLVTCKRNDELAEAINRMAENPALCERFGARASVVYQEKFTVERMTESTLAVYRESLS